jgi:dihydrofolate synthase/folylpolyglutamate synthase
LDFADFAAVERYLNSLVNYEQTFPLGGNRDRPKLEPALNAVARMELPQTLPGCIHIAGTKGKGSVVAFLESLLAPNHNVLSFSSPHLMSVKERVRLQGNLLDDELWQKGFGAMTETLLREPVIKLTYFESVFIFYLWAARELGTDVNVVEAGLGGKWDATNILKKTMAVLTRVDYDHTEILGKTLTEIATDKSGIIKPLARVIVGRQPGEALSVYELRIAAERAKGAFFGADFGWLAENGGRFRYQDLQRTIGSLSLSVSGTHQRDNASIAIRAATMLFDDLEPDAIREAISRCVIPGRQQLLPGKPDVLVDVAHNPVSFRALADTLKENYRSRRIFAVIGMVKDKDARGSLAALQGIVSDIRIVALNNPRSYKQQDLCEIAMSLGFEVECTSSQEEAFAALHREGNHDLGLVAGSFYLAGDYLIWRERAGIT